MYDLFYSMCHSENECIIWGETIILQSYIQPQLKFAHKREFVWGS